jgi:hypothetical protein
MDTRIGRLGLAWSSVLLMAAGAAGQEHEHIYLPPTRGATPLSTIIDAQSHWIAGYGDFLESAAVARKINAEAVALEIENSIRYIEAYFERKRLNKEARAPDRNYLLREAKRQEVIKKRIATQYQDLLKEADLSDRLNWLLTELSGPAMACHYLSQADKQSLADYDQPLPPGALEQIWLTDGGKKGSQLLFPAGSAEVLKTDWPPGLRDNQPPELADARAHFEAARDKAVKEVRANQGKVTQETSRELYQAVNELFVVLEAAYPRERRAEPAEFLNYNTAKHYVQSLLAQVNRVVTTSDPMVFDQTLAFKGKTVLDLLQHLYQTGLVFAPPKNGGERVYRNLFESMRNVYLALGEVSDAELKAAPAPAQKP